MTARPSALLDDLDTAHLALAPIRRRILAALIAPASAAGLAEQLEMPRQKIGYHLKALEDAGLIRLAGERKKRGFTERLFVAAERYVLDPGLLQAPPDPDAADKQDRHAASHLIHTASAMVRDVARMREAADAEGARLLTLTVEADLTFARPADFDAFSRDVAEAVAGLARRYSAPEGRRYRLTAAAHPAVVKPAPARN
ncbi:helix-turn-helix domain-containing protein [Brevundimonas sp. FT23042]|uniref:helix-turn-helix domain-containing protein n=1 Tax=Brevundimonas sp. FT23042 TaxID=3393749 RepID=UPI003B58A72B